VLTTPILWHILTELSKPDETGTIPGKPRRIVFQHVVSIYCHYLKNGDVKITIIPMKSTIDENLAFGTV